MLKLEKHRSEARGNGANSQGPVTLFSRDVVLSNEDPATWEALRVSFHSQWLPANQVQALLVDELAATQWKLLRAESIETAIFNAEMDILEPEVEKTFRKIDEPTRQALAFKSLADQSKVLAALERHQTRLHRQFQRTSKQLAEMGKSTPEPKPEATQPEASKAPQPTPIRQNPTKSDTPERNPATKPDQEDSTPPCRAA